MGFAFAADILVLPFFGQGHLNPCSELCKRISSIHNCKLFFIIPSHLSSSIPSDLHRHPSIEVVEIDSSSPPPETEAPDGDPVEQPPRHRQQMGQGIESFLAGRFEKVRPAFVVMDVMMNWSKEIFKREGIPIVAFFTSGGCATAMEYAAWKGHVEGIGPDEARLLPGLPESLALTYADTKRRRRNDGGGGGGRPDGPKLGPPGFNHPTRWMDETEGSAALLINTCDDIEAPFLEYLSGQVEKPVFGVGPLLPETFWKSIGSGTVRDRGGRPNRKSNYTEDEVIEWLDSKPHCSVIYISFGSEVGPSMAEYDELADALAETSASFIWVIQLGAGKPGTPLPISGGIAAPEELEGGYEPHGLEERVGNRGLIIKGWAPQLPILGHPSTGGFLSHCGWNSTVEAIGSGVPILAWPIRGDQFYVAKLVAKYLNVGHMIPYVDDISKTVKKLEIVRGIEVLMDDEGVRDRAMALRGVFEAGYPSSSAASLKALIEHMSK